MALAVELLPGPDTVSRKRAATALGLSYATLRVYEKALGDLLILTWGRTKDTHGNFAVLYPPPAVALVRKAVEAKASGIPFAKLRAYFTGTLTADPAAPSLLRVLQALDRIEAKLAYLEGELIATRHELAAQLQPR